MTRRTAAGRLSTLSLFALLCSCSGDVPTAATYRGGLPHSAFAVTVFPNGSKYMTVSAYSSGNEKEFWVKNTSTSSGTTSLGCAATGGLSCTSTAPGSVSLSPGESTGVTVTFSAGAPNSFPYDTVKATSPYGGPGKVRVVVE